MKSPIFKIIFKILLSSAAITAIFYYLILPELGNLAKNQIALEKVSSEYRQADRKLKDLNKINKNKADLQSTEKTVNDYLPDTPSASTFIVSLEQMTSQTPIIIDSLSVTETKTQKTASKKPSNDSETTSDKKTQTTSASTSATQSSEKALEFNASFKAEYNNILAFFSKIEKMDRFNTIESFSLGNMDEKTSTISFQAAGKIYYGK